MRVALRLMREPVASRHHRNASPLLHSSADALERSVTKTREQLVVVTGRQPCCLGELGQVVKTLRGADDSQAFRVDDVKNSGERTQRP